MALENKYVNLFKFNNYRNKIRKGVPTWNTGYVVSRSRSDGGRDSLVNFKPNDGIHTTFIFDYNEDEFNYDYLSVSTKNDGSANRSNWFIINTTRLNGNKMQLDLIRDIITDKFYNVVNTEMRIERGFCYNDNPAIYNKEGIDFNEIKVSETLLKDKTNCAWIIMYIPNNLTLADDVRFKLPTFDKVNTISGIANLPYASTDNKIYVTKNCVLSGVIFRQVPNLFTNNYYKYPFYTKNGNKNIVNVKDEFAITHGRLGYFSGTVEQAQTYVNSLVSSQQYVNSWLSDFYNYSKNNDEHLLFDESIMDEDGKVYYDTTNNKYYTIHVSRTSNIKKFSSNISANTALGARVISLFNTQNWITHENNPSGSIATGNLNVYEYIYTAEETTYNPNSFKMKKEDLNNDYPVKNQPYKMVAFPMKKFYIEKGVGSVEENETQLVYSDPEIIKAFISEFAKDNGRVLDIQQVPYCPCLEDYMVLGGIEELFIGNRPTINLWNSDNNVVARGIFINNDSFSIYLDNSYYPNNYKIENECEKYRLCSPHYESAFEFNAVQMQGWAGIKVECTYKPYEPYFHLIPMFTVGSLYGEENFEDARGLVSNCSYSLPLSSDVWQTWARQNSTYQLTFDREIKDLSVKHNIEQFANATELLGSSYKNKMTKNLNSNFISGATNMFTNELDYRETKSFREDMFYYNLKNIKAQPETLTKVSALDINNRIWPILEKYSCTEDEKIYFEKYLVYNSYRIERIGKIKDYINPNQELTFIKASLIIFESNNMTPEMTNFLNEELSHGVYLKGDLFNE